MYTVMYFLKRLRFNRKHFSNMEESEEYWIALNLLLEY
jgi:hypothetical protein